MRDSWKNIGLVVCVTLIIMLIPNYAQAKSKTEVKGIPQVSIFKQDNGFGIWNLVVKTREGKLLVCYEDGRNLEVMRTASDLIQSVIYRNNEHEGEVDDKGEIAVIGDYDPKNDLFNLNQVICLESLKKEDEPQELVVDTDYNDKTSTLNNRYVIFDEVVAAYDSGKIKVGVGVPFWWSFWLGNFRANYAWLDPWGTHHYWRRPHIVHYYWDGVCYWRSPYFRRPYWRYYRWRPWYWGYRRGRYGCGTHPGHYFDCPDRKRNPNEGRQFKRVRSQTNARLGSPHSFSTERRTSLWFRGHFPRYKRPLVRGFKGTRPGIGGFRGRR